MVSQLGATKNWLGATCGPWGSIWSFLINELISKLLPYATEKLTNEADKLSRLRKIVSLLDFNVHFLADNAIFVV